MKIDMDNTYLAGVDSSEQVSSVRFDVDNNILYQASNDTLRVKKIPGDATPSKGDRRDLFGTLVQAPVGRELLVRINKTALTTSSEDHSIVIQNVKHDPTANQIKVRDGLTVTVVDGHIDTNDFTATFSRGRIGLVAGKPGAHYRLSCENLDEITFNVDPR